MNRMTYLALVSALVVGVATAGCESDDEGDSTSGAESTELGGDEGEEGNEGGGEIAVPATYAFDSRFVDESSVSYSGQIKRHTLIDELKSYIGSLDDQSFDSPEPGDIASALLFYFDFSTVGFDEYGIGISSHLPIQQSTMGDLGSLANLRDKMPEVDAGFEAAVIGYGQDLSPSGAVEDMFDKLEALVIERANGNLPTDPDGVVIDVPFVDAAGVDYQQLIQKFLLGAVPYSQGADDYLDDDIEGKGLLSDNTVASGDPGEEDPYTQLEHIWDEGFGYFGASRNYDAYTDEEIAQSGGREEWQGAQDTNGDGVIDLKSEYVFGVAQNAAKRDLGAVVPTDFTAEAFSAFLRGRTLIVNAGGALSDNDLATLRAERDTILKAWEDSIAATAVHYVNDTLQDMNTFGTEDYSFRDHAKHWSELKGFALSLQFNPNHGSWTTADLEELQDLIGSAPVLPNADEGDIEAYREDLIAARALIGDMQGFDAENLGDDNGENGW